MSILHKAYEMNSKCTADIFFS
uniref:Uncharacterized protein n=1 Tax=Arundo donax TaxID=35708 RepID=A0A0A9C3W0_ARUDO